MSIKTKTVVVVRPGALVNRKGTRRVAAVISNRDGDYRCVWLTDHKGNGGPTVFYASLNADKWQEARASFYFDGAASKRLEDMDEHPAGLGLVLPTDPKSIAEGFRGADGSHIENPTDQEDE